MRGRKRPHSGSNRGTRISAVSTIGGGASIIRKNKRVVPNATLTSAAASNDNDEVSCGFGLVRGFVHLKHRIFVTISQNVALGIHMEFMHALFTCSDRSGADEGFDVFPCQNLENL